MNLATSTEQLFPRTQAGPQPRYKTARYSDSAANSLRPISQSQRQPRRLGGRRELKVPGHSPGVPAGRWLGTTCHSAVPSGGTRGARKCVQAPLRLSLREAAQRLLRRSSAGPSISARWTSAGAWHRYFHTGPFVLRFAYLRHVYVSSSSFRTSNGGKQGCSPHRSSKDPTAISAEIDRKATRSVPRPVRTPTGTIGVAHDSAGPAFC